MSVLPRSLLLEARKIAERKDDEIARRTAIGRAYYAAFHGAKKFHASLPRPGRSVPGVGEHENLIHQLRHPDPAIGEGLLAESVKIGGLLLQLRPLRVIADYELQTPVTARDMNDAIAKAAQIVNLTDPK